ncbi:MAG: DUF1684 domain-containing protein [Acidobacteria bacterium]|nr:DUF1684 domain-containing protein [Acidobacteriota bacterium]
MKTNEFTLVAIALSLFLSCAKTEAPAPVADSAAPATQAETAPAKPQTHAEEVEAWRARRIANLTREDGWLTLVGLAWLREGANSVGSDPKSIVALPEGKGAAIAGTIQLANGVATFVPAEGATITFEGKPVTAAIAMKPDTSESPTVLHSGPVRFYIIERGGKLGVRIKDSESEARTHFTGIDSYPLDSKWRIEARFEKYDPPKQIAITNVLGQTEPQPCPGAIVFEVDGTSYRLEPILEGDDPDLFIIFGDSTNRTTTYGAGRFLYATPPGPDGKVIVDFNKAYNPPCVFSPFATCPLPPKQNKLPIAIEAGEKRWGEH